MLSLVSLVSVYLGSPCFKISQFCVMVDTNKSSSCFNRGNCGPRHLGGVALS